MRPSHKYTIHRARLDAQRTKHALRVIDRVARNLEALAALDPLFADVNAIHRASLRALITRDARREVEPMNAPISCGHRHWQFWILEVLGEGLALGPIRLDPGSKRNPHAVRNGVDRIHDIAQPGPESLQRIDHWAASFPGKIGR